MAVSTSMLNKWDYSGIFEVYYSDHKCESYKKAAEFLVDDVEDWGGGTGWAGRYFKKYKNIEGSKHPKVDIQADLVKYTSKCKNILIRQVIEYNYKWKTILENAKKSFSNKLCLIVMNPFVEKTRVNDKWNKVSGKGKVLKDVLPNIFFRKQDILDLFPSSEYKVSEETIKTNHGYGQDWILYVQKITG